MSPRYRVALQGFDGLERQALEASLRAAPQRIPGYDEVASVEEAEFLVADSDRPHIVEPIVAAGREADTVFVGSSAPLGSMAHLRRPFEAGMVLRELDRLVTHRIARAVVPSAPVAPQLDFPPLIVEELPLSDMLPLSGPMPFSPSVSGALTDWGAPSGAIPLLESPITQDGDDEATRAKAAARAAARRARLKQIRRQTAALPPITEVLVLDDAEPERLALCELLEQFGFRARVAASSDEARALVDRVPFAALFLDVVLGVDDPTDGLALCREFKRSAQGTPVLLLSERAGPTDRVRGQLAGCDAFLVKPVGRGDVAKALEGLGVPLPADARRL